MLWFFMVLNACRGGFGCLGWRWLEENPVNFEDEADGGFETEEGAW